MPPHAKPTDEKENHALSTPQPSAKKSCKTHAKDASMNPKAPLKQAKWSSADDVTLIQVLMDQQGGNQADNSWKGCVWEVVCTELAGSELLSGGAPKTAEYQRALDLLEVVLPMKM